MTMFNRLFAVWTLRTMISWVQGMTCTISPHTHSHPAHLHPTTALHFFAKVSRLSLTPPLSVSAIADMREGPSMMRARGFTR